MVFFLLWISAWVDLIQSSCERSSSGSSLSHRFWKHGIEIVFYGFLLFASRERFWVVAQVMTLSWMVIVLTLALQKKLTWVSVALLMLCCLGHHFGSLLRAVDRHWELGWSSQSTSLVDEPAEKKAFVFLYKIARLRQDFIKSYDQASNLDVQVQFNSDADVLRYMPRALMVATFSPFPSMWFKVGGKGGALGRRVAGLEMIGMTFVIIMAITGSIRRKWPWTELCVWCAILVQLMALGLVVTNGGALYRMRFVCWFLLILLAFGRQTSPKKA
jgi:hypothetical protein